MKEDTFTVADYLLTRLQQLDVTELFQIPGDYVKNFTQALEKFDGIETIGTSNELDASYAADAYGRTRGLAAVSLQYGVSTFSALNAVAGAYVESSPIVVISATPGSNDRQIGDMYDVLYHHSTGNLKCYCCFRNFEYISWSSKKNRQTFSRCYHTQKTRIHRCL
ncbi:thiamine pyrophosphate-binding protein [Tenacibaculum sp. 190130A14a]|uniref:Thiamine pyrophosphate enzyme N-terminal TPP-binding domain-containing protein n=1 Tax=Tenacibaculum polynesiense TaxID=3137857 RepID=A0ABP1EXH2_9FLAO